MKRRLIYLPGVLCAVVIAVFLCGCQEPTEQIVVQTEPSVEGLLSAVMDGGGTFEDVPFASLIEQSTDRQVIAVDPSDQISAELLSVIETAMASIFVKFNQTDSEPNQEKRINEVSSHFEEALREAITAEAGWTCDYPRNAEGNLQRAGYPDLMIRHEASGLTAYLDPKLVEQGSLKSSLRTFYFTPRRETSKVLHDAHHLLIGIEHDGNTGDWRYLRWHLVDLSDFRVRLKAEFQASNRDLYVPELIILKGGQPEEDP
ncbi:MAG: hypothetical protein AAF236_17675 [Verrucomicrobiota bacterium]